MFKLGHGLSKTTALVPPWRCKRSLQLQVGHTERTGTWLRLPRQRCLALTQTSASRDDVFTYDTRFSRSGEYMIVSRSMTTPSEEVTVGRVPVVAGMSNPLAMQAQLAVACGKHGVNRHVIAVTALVSYEREPAVHVLHVWKGIPTDVSEM